MRIGLYGMPTAGKTFILDKIDFLDVIVGSKLLREYDPDFDKRDEEGREKDRKAVAELMLQRDNFIMDGHYAFGDEIAFTEEEGQMYDIYLYLYVAPEIIRERMKSSAKNQKYLKHDIELWQQREMDGLREYCHKNCKDFYVIDNPPENKSEDYSNVIEFLKQIVNGYSCAEFARDCAADILKLTDSQTIYLFDGDKTLTIEDSSKKIMGYTTNIYDGNYYTGYQTWKQYREFENYRPMLAPISSLQMNLELVGKLNESSFILTSGNESIWNVISNNLNVSCFSGNQMSAETKAYIVKYLKAAGRRVVAYGDGMNDYYMLREADSGYLVARPDGSLSRSLNSKNLEGITIVHT